MVRIDRVTGRRVYGTFPVAEDPKSSVIWEAFQPETEPRRTFRRSAELAADRSAKAATPAAARPRPRAAPRPAQPADSNEFLLNQGGIY
jgi:penicillin-binding protein 1A